jgi:nucleoside-diphosphate-sugar epimerase
MAQLKKYDPVALDNLDSRCGGTAISNFIRCDITDYNALQAAILDHQITHIIHLAAYGRNLTCKDFPNQAWIVNVWGTRNLLEIAKAHRATIQRVVVCSSNIVLSDQFTDYKKTKVQVENEVKTYAGYGVSVMGLRPSNIYGAGQSKTEHQLCAFAGLDECYRKNGYFEISGDGTQTRDWVHADDVARAFELALMSDVRGQTVDVCTGVQTSMNDVAKMLSVPVKYTNRRPGDAKELISDPGPAQRLLGFKSAIELSTRIRDAFPSLALPSTADMDAVSS